MFGTYFSLSAPSSGADAIRWTITEFASPVSIETRLLVIVTQSSKDSTYRQLDNMLVSSMRQLLSNLVTYISCCE